MCCRHRTVLTRELTSTDCSSVNSTGDSNITACIGLYEICAENVELTPSLQPLDRPIGLLAALHLLHRLLDT